MSRLAWDDLGKRSYEIGVDRGVLYPTGESGVPWNGLIAVQEAPSGADISESHQDGRKIRNRRMGEGFSATISAYTYPREFEKYDGVEDGLAGQNRPYFGFSYRTRLATDTENDAGSLIHLVYNAQATPSQKSYSSIGASINPVVFSWAIDTTPVILADGSITSHLIVNTKMAYSWAVDILEDLIYGSASNDPQLPSIPGVLDIFENASILKITDHGDGTWTADGPDEAIVMIDPTTFRITWPSAVYLDDVTYRISSL
jgi:hypothetical protein